MGRVLPGEKQRWTTAYLAWMNHMNISGRVLIDKAGLVGVNQNIYIDNNSDNDNREREIEEVVLTTHCA